MLDCVVLLLQYSLLCPVGSVLLALCCWLYCAVLRCAALCDQTVFRCAAPLLHVGGGVMGCHGQQTEVRRKRERGHYLQPCRQPSCVWLFLRERKVATSGEYATVGGESCVQRVRVCVVCAPRERIPAITGRTPCSLARA